MKKTIKIITNTLVILALLLQPLTALAAIGSTPKIQNQEEIFDPDYIISDKEMQNWQSMSANEIQVFLEEKNSYLASYTTKNLEEERKLASQIIASAAREHKINPKYILIKLQKEQSLIKDQNPDQKQLDWAAGYGVCDSCTTTDADIQEHKGFAHQVDSAAGIIRWYYDNVGTNSVVKQPRVTYDIDDQQVRPANFATAFLYTYTPHIHGNKNFWKLWERWFEQVYPDGSLVQAYGDKNVFLIKDGKKHKFKNYTALSSRFNPNRIINIPKSELSRYESGDPISLPNYAILKEGANYYLLDDDRLRPFANRDVIRELGYHPGEIIDVKESDIEQYEIGEEITSDTKNPRGRLVKAAGQIYYIKNKTYHPIYDKKIAKVNFPSLSIEEVSASKMQKMKRGNAIKLKDGTLFGVKGNNKIFVVENGKRRHISDEEVFETMGYKWENVVWISSHAGHTHPLGQPIYIEGKKQRLTASHKGSDPEKFEPENEELKELVDKIIKTPENQQSKNGPEFQTPIEAYTVMDYGSGEILASKNANFARPMASFAKVMTAQQLFKEGLNEKFITTYNPQKHKAKYHRYKISEGEMVRNEDLLDAFLVSSLNTPGNMLVDKTANNKKQFVEKMNQKVESWGLEKTKFVDVTGERIANKTTAKEYAKLFKKALGNNKIKQELDRYSYEYKEVLNKDDREKHFDTNSNDLLKRESVLPFSILASKTGYLHEAGDNLAMLIEDKETKEKYIIITMGNSELNNEFAEPEALAKWVLNTF